MTSNKMKNFIKAGNLLIPLSAINRADISSVEQGIVHIVYDGDKEALLEGADALDAVMRLNPSALEGRRLRWFKNAWALHNLVAHPLMQALVWLGCPKQAIWLHDVTVPRPIGVKNQ